MGDISQQLPGYRLGVDVGGTFTDVCVITPHGDSVRAKAPSTSPDQSVGVKQAIDKVRATLLAEYGWSGKFDYVHHGTTVATNAVLEGKGSKAALVVTEGHKDILNLRRSQIPGALGAWLTWDAPTPVIPLELTVDAPERTAIDGKIVDPLDVAKFRRNLIPLKQENLDVISISLINSFANNKHELEVARILREEFPSVEIVLSSDVLPEVGEYERTVTASANALVKPTIKRYVSHLSTILNEDSDTIRILKSDGGLTGLKVAEELPVNLLMSGPAGGVRGVCQTVGAEYSNLITLDVGGTSTDCALIVNGMPALRRETVIGTLSVKAPSIDVHTVGAGGGSIARYSALSKHLRVGPESAGASPGPACYGNGGREPTVTDANLVLGYLPSTLLGGDFKLDVAAAIASVSSLASQVGLTTEETAQGIIDLANETMYGAVRVVSVEKGYDPKDFSLVVFGGAGPLHANAIGELLGSWPVIIPPSPGILCAQGDVITRLSHEKTKSYITGMSTLDLDDFTQNLNKLVDSCCSKLLESSSIDISHRVTTECKVDLRYIGQSQELTVTLDRHDLEDGLEQVKNVLRKSFEDEHRRQYTFIMPQYDIELMRMRVIASDNPPEVSFHTSSGGEDGEKPPLESAIIDRKMIYHKGQYVEAVVWDRKAISLSGTVLRGPCIVNEVDSNTLVLPGYVAKVDRMHNLVVNPEAQSKTAVEAAGRETSMSREAAARYVTEKTIIPTLIESALASIRREMDSLMLRASMSPGIREQQDEFNVVTNASGQMLVGQFGSFIPDFLRVYHGLIEEGDVFITNDAYEMEGAVSHLNDAIILVPIFFQGKIVGWAANFGHLTDVQGSTPGSLSIDARTIYDDGLQIPVVKLYSKGVINQEVITILCRNSRAADWFRADVFALLSSCNTAALRVQELCERYGLEVYEAATDVLLHRNKIAVQKLIDTVITDEPAEFIDFIDDDGHGVGPFAIKCTMTKRDGKLFFDWDGTSPQSEFSINYLLSKKMFTMYIVYYLLAIIDPYTLVNSGANDLIEIDLPLGSILNPVRPAALSCRTHLLGRVFDVIQALLGQHMPAHRAAAGFSDSPHIFYSGFKPTGDFFLLYQIGFGGVPARPAGDGLDCHCLFPSIKSIPVETIELYFPLRIELNEALADSGGAGFYRGGNAQRTLYHFLCAGDMNLHDDRAFTKAWGCDGGYPGLRSRKVLIEYSKDAKNPPRRHLRSKQDHIRVEAGDVLEWVTWGGGGIGDPLTRPAEKVLTDVKRRLVTTDGAASNYGVVIDPKKLTVQETETANLRAELAASRKSADSASQLYNRGGTLEELEASFVAETGFPALRPQWEQNPYGPHVKLPYVQEWYKKMREQKGWPGL
ncbi:hypothetical protein PV10_00415 [Exophiala mesophila]|uniref:Uncharacterized protein n=1 Tax=Exophiala mesophila TaxID=212818 RepID=A0A0D1ZPQ6_EXOME|nr:uncharacterized protein PV10_00415 [Exophiala mesophila]KIV96567.1 hypothetical protein PV10_00415 [Exophiala mesophila]